MVLLRSILINFTTSSTPDLSILINFTTSSTPDLSILINYSIDFRRSIYSKQLYYKNALTILLYNDQPIQINYKYTGSI